MALLANIVQDVKFWAQYQYENTPLQSNLFKSGIIEQDPVLSTYVAAAGWTWSGQLWADLSRGIPAQKVSDTVPLAADTLGSKTYNGYKLQEACVYKASDLAADLSADDPMGRIQSRYMAWWEHQFQDVMVRILRGAFASTLNATNRLNVSATVGIGGALTFENVVEAKALLGESLAGSSSRYRIEDFCLLTTPRAYFNLEKQDFLQTDFYRQSDKDPAILAFGKMPVIASDALVTGGANQTSYLVHKGFFKFGETAAATPWEVDRDSALSTDVLYNRRYYAIQPQGLSALAALPANPTRANLEAATSWGVVLDPDNIPVIQLITNA